MDNSLCLDLLPSTILGSLPKLPQDLFPLPLSAFEKYLIWDETPEQPMNSFIELRFFGTLQLEVMEEAINAAARIHPLFNCTVAGAGGRPFWSHQADYRHQVYCEAERPVLRHGRPIPIDLTSEPGIRFWYRQWLRNESEPSPAEWAVQKRDGQTEVGSRPCASRKVISNRISLPEQLNVSRDGSGQTSDHRARSRLLIQLHHATSDGVGLRRFVIDALVIYAHCTSSNSVDSGLRMTWNKVDLSLLKRRSDVSDSFGGPPSQTISTWQRIKNAHYFHFQLPKPLATPAVKASSVAPVADVEPLEHLVIDRDTSEAILESARLSQIGINELSLALLFQTCSLWNQRHGDWRPRSRIRILMPYDLRSRIDLRMPATNRLSFSFLGRTQSECQDLAALIRSIGSEVQSLRQTQLPLDFLSALEGASRHPRLMRWVMRHSPNMATAVLTYAGEMFRGIPKYFPEHDGRRIVGDVHLEQILAAPPVRKNTHWSLGLCINGGQLCISAAWNRDALSRQQCVQLLQLYRSRWLHWLSANDQS